MKNLLIIAFYTLITSPLLSQTWKISGMVVDQSEIPQEFVNILLLNPVDSSLIKGVVTDLEGIFEIERVSEGTYLVAASMVGYNDAYTSIINISGQDLNIGKLTLTEGVALNEVTVTAKKPFIEMKADKLVVNVEGSSVNSGNSALEVLEKSPGITLDNDNNISLRGKQGVLVMINGKNQYMSGDELVRMLESMPSENIQSIEIIANPSSRYDAEGNSGIINIRLKKNENYGYNGSVNAGFRQGVMTTYNTGLDFNYRSSKINVFGSGSYYDFGNFNDLNLYRKIPNSEGITNFDQNSYLTFGGISFNGKLGLDVFLTDRTTIGLLYKNNSGIRDFANDNVTYISGTNTPFFDILSVTAAMDGYSAQHSYNFNVLHKLNDNGANLSFDVDYSAYDFQSMNTYDNLYLDLNENPLDEFHPRNDQMTGIDIFAAMLDYTQPLNNGYQLEMGAKLSMVSTDNNTQFDALNNDVWESQVDRTNNFLYLENVFASYANLSKSFGKVSLQAGLRMEHTKSIGNSVTLDQKVPRNYTNLFPSFSLSHPIGEKHSLSYTYSKRLNRPNYQSLNPFIEYLDDYTFERGNPFLNPQYSDAFGVNYGFGGFLFISANYSYTKDAITQVIEQNTADNTTFQTEQNLDNFNSASLTVSAPIPLKNYGTTRISLTSFYNDFQSAIPSGTLDNQGFGYNIYVGNQFNLPAGISMEVNGNYRSGLVYGLFQIQPQYGIDFGFSKSFMEGKGNIKIGMDDIFRTRLNNVDVMQDDIFLQVRNIRDTRRAKINVSYKFGNNKVKNARRRTTATEAETQRIQSE